jgi:hypothetical protein
MANLKIVVNNSEIDQPYVEVPESGDPEWIEVDTANDTLIPSAGSANVSDGLIPDEGQITRAGAVASETEVVTVPKYFLRRDGGVVNEIFNAGAKIKRYVFGFDFDDETVTEPVLELWDDSGMLTFNSDVLGAGNASESWFWGIVTTNGNPGAGWDVNTPGVGKKLAGGDSAHILFLNGGSGASPLDAAKTLYCQLKTVIPINPGVKGSFAPAFAVKWVSN